jgi:signal transduction histidine kinase
MKTFLKQFTALVTNLETNVFESTRLKLTALYVVTMLVIMVIFSGALYNAIAKNVRVRLNTRPNVGFGFVAEPRIPIEIQRVVREEILADIRQSIFLLDLFLTLFIALIGYILAGKTLEPVQKAFEKQKRFVADASHDLRTPLTAMQTEIEVALRDKGEGQARHVLESTLSEVRTLSSLVNDLVLMARIDGDSLPKKNALNITAVLHGVVKKIEPEAHAKKLALTVTVQEGSMLGFESLLVRAFMNVIENAVTYTSSGSITITGVSEKDTYIVTVTDTGVGIPKDDLPHIFDRFYRGTKARSDVHHSGLGLAITKEIIDLHKGKISIESSEAGTIVTLTLPTGENI